MPRIPTVPTLDPVNKPSESPGEAGKVGGAIAGLGEVSEDAAATGQALDIFIKKAQEHVDTMAARNELDAAYAQTQDQLAKTANSRDVPDVIEQGNKTLNDISARWSKSPAAIAIQQDADALRPSLTHVGTVKQVDLMGKEFKVTLSTQGEKLAAVYAAGDRDSAEAAFGTAVDGGVKTGLVGSVEAEEYMRQFREEGQKLEIKNGITNADPAVNQKIYDDINAHREDFADVPQEQLDTFKGQALSAVESHIKFQDWSQGQMAQNTMLRPLIDQHTNPATKMFDVDAARADVAEQFRTGKITLTQQNVLETGLKAYQADVAGAVDKQAAQFQDNTIKMFHDHKYSEAYAALEKQRPWLEQNGQSDLYKGLMNYGDTQIRSERAEEREELSLSRQEEAETSSETFGRMQSAMAQGQIFTDAQILNLAGKGKGKMRSADVSEAIRMSHAYKADPNYEAAIKLANDSLGVGKDADVDTQSRSAKRLALTSQQFQQRVNANPNEDKVKAMQEVLKPAIQEHITEQVNAIFGAPPPTTLQRIERFFVGKPADSKTAAPGVQTFKDGGRTYSIPDDKVGEFEKDHPNATPSSR